MELVEADKRREDVVAQMLSETITEDLCDDGEGDEIGGQPK